jgi:hypothetical protein
MDYRCRDSEGRDLSAVMPGLDPGIHVFLDEPLINSWIIRVDANVTPTNGHAGFRSRSISLTS